MKEKLLTSFISQPTAVGIQTYSRAANPLVKVGVACLVVWLLLRANQIQQRTVAPAAADEERVQVLRVVDGDTLLITGNRRVRLLGVDTPETKHPDRPVEPFGHQATEFTTNLVEGETVTLVFDKERYDDYRRILAFVFLNDGRLLNEELVLAGLATAEVQYPFRSDMKKRLVSAEKLAQSSGKGIWSGKEKLNSE